jgi:hypothetical protein
VTPVQLPTVLADPYGRLVLQEIMGTPHVATALGGLFLGNGHVGSLFQFEVLEDSKSRIYPKGLRNPVGFLGTSLPERLGFGLITEDLQRKKYRQVVAHRFGQIQASIFIEAEVHVRCGQLPGRLILREFRTIFEVDGAFYPQHETRATPVTVSFYPSDEGPLDLRGVPPQADPKLSRENLQLPIHHLSGS